MGDVTCLSIKMYIQLLFIPFLFSTNFCSVDPHVVSNVSNGCNLSSSALFYVVFKLMYRCINAVFNTGKSSSSFFT